jgi:hypothetical protein
VGLGHRHKRLLAGQAGMRLQIVKPQPPKNHVSAQRACDSSCVSRSSCNTYG